MGVLNYVMEKRQSHLTSSLLLGIAVQKGRIIEAHTPGFPSSEEDSILFSSLYLANGGMCPLSQDTHT